ncbi:MAG: hypothetical protein ACRCWC_15580 [Plesiomonas shigelloides]
MRDVNKQYNGTVDCLMDNDDFMNDLREQQIMDRVASYEQLSVEQLITAIAVYSADIENLTKSVQAAAFALHKRHQEGEQACSIIVP